MTNSNFVYVTWIRTTPAKVWQAITDPQFTRQFWVECWQDCDWKPGSSWKLVCPDGSVADSGEVIELELNRRIVLRWRNEFKPELREEGDSRMTWDIEQKGDSVKLTVTHTMERENAKFIEAVSNGWPLILSGLKTLLETGVPLDDASHFHKRACAEKQP